MNPTTNSFYREPDESRGFTVGVSLLFILLVGFLLALIIPLVLKARERAALASNIEDMKRWATGITTFIKNNGIAPTNPLGPMNYKKKIIKEVSPYLTSFSVYDWRGYPFRIWTGKGNFQYGIMTTETTDFIIASVGSDGMNDGWKYDKNNLRAGLYKINKIDDFKNDLVIWNDNFIRWPIFK